VLVLCVDSATPAVTAAVVEVPPGGGPVRTLAVHCEVDARRHGELLAPAVAEVLRSAGVAATDLHAVAAGLGPGPFTSLRVGVVTAAAVAAALGLPAYGACSLDLLAAELAARAAAQATTHPDAAAGCVVATDARRRELYWARYDAAGHRVEGPVVSPPDQLVSTLRSGERVVGGGTLLYPDDLRAGGAVLSGPLVASAALLGGLVAERVRAGAPGETLRPLYLRRPDATEPAPAR
jgi:tRNA threonylcarbamoyl adenosine modification protein YeaZ